MRKSAVVVTAAVSAVLAGGIMVATAAGTEQPATTSAAPSMELPELPAVPQLPDADDVPVAPRLPAVPVDPAGQAAPDRPAIAADPAKPAVDRPTEPEAKKTQAGTSDARPDAKPVAAKRTVAKRVVAKRTVAKRTVAKRMVAKRTAGKRVVGKRVVAGRAGAGRSTTEAAARRRVTAGQALSSDPRGSVQQQALDLVNHDRRRDGCKNLVVDRRLIAAANRHASEMARRGYFAHVNSRGERAGERVRDAGYKWSRYGENIARGQGSVADVVDDWMKSPDHRENIMDCDLREVGVGLAFGADRTPYWVQDFASPR